MNTVPCPNTVFIVTKSDLLDSMHSLVNTFDVRSVTNRRSTDVMLKNCK